MLELVDEFTKIFSSISISKFRKKIGGNTTIIAHKIYELQQQIREALHTIIIKKPELIELTLKIATMFWNAFNPFFNILFFLIILYFCWYRFLLNSFDVISI